MPHHEIYTRVDHQKQKLLRLQLFLQMCMILIRKVHLIRHLLLLKCGVINIARLRVRVGHQIWAMNTSTAGQQIGASLLAYPRSRIT